MSSRVFNGFDRFNRLLSRQNPVDVNFAKRWTNSLSYPGKPDESYQVIIVGAGNKHHG